VIALRDAIPPGRPGLRLRERKRRRLGLSAEDTELPRNRGRRSRWSAGPGQLLSPLS
jgi:hypothetical protein